MTKKGGTGKDKNKWLYLVAVIGQAIAGDEDVKLFEEFFSATITASIGNAATRRVGNNSKASNSNSDSDSNSNSSSNQKSTVTKKRGGKVTSASGGGGSADDSDGSLVLYAALLRPTSPKLMMIMIANMTKIQLWSVILSMKPQL